MTPEQERRLTRLHRMANLFVTATLRARRERQEQDDRINILITFFEKNEQRFARNEERFERTEQAIERLIAAQARTDEKLQALIDAIRGRNPGELFT